MDEMHLCVCCLRCPPDEDLTTPYTHHDKTEIYSDILQDCFNIQMVLDGWSSCGICSACAGRLRDASDFKLLVQRCQAELRARMLARSRVKVEEPDTELPTEHEEETGCVLQELLGPGLADGDGASDDEESPVKPEMITVDEAALYEEPAVKAEAAAGAASDEDRPQHASAITGAESATLLRGGGGGGGGGDRRPAARLERLRAPPPPPLQPPPPHPPANEDHTYACDICTLRFNSKSVLVRHIGTHYRCKVCNTAFMMNACLTRHERNCTDNKQNGPKLANSTLSKSHGEDVLYYCDAPARTIYILQKHEKTHTDEKLFECGFCGYTCSRKVSLQRHQRIHTGDKPFECGYCDYKCSLKSTLNKHQRIHTREKPFLCGYGDYKCSLRSTLQRHERKHTREKRIKCGHCNLKFSDKSSLQQHQRVHTVERPFGCGYCDYTCSLKSNLRKHERIHQRPAVYM